MAQASLLWFKRDLRAADHPALALAAAQGAVLPLYIVEPDYWAQPDTSARQWAFVAECLEDLREDLGRLGAPLAIRVGDAAQVLEKLCRAHKITRIISHEETGNLWTYARDRRVAAWARASGIEWVELPQSGVMRRMAGRDAFAAGPLAEVTSLQAVSGVEPGAIPSARALRLAEDRCPHRQAGGRSRGLLLLDTFLTLRAEGYRAAMASPLAGERACSRVSPHLAMGTLSGREAAQATAARLAERPGGAWGGSLTSFQGRLSSRDTVMQRLEDRADLEHRCLHPAAEGLRPRDSDAARLSAWEKGETGLPFLDACMRYLAATGWLHSRLRGMVIGAASYQLWLDWRAGGTVLARRCTDYEPGIHWPQVQDHSGTTGAGTIRILNPVQQGQLQDPTGAFTRRWVPELAPVPDEMLQEPWKWSGASRLLGRRYPEPVVDVAASTRAARDLCRALHKPRAARTDGFEVLEQPPRRPRPAPAGQLCLDL